MAFLAEIAGITIVDKAIVVDRKEVVPWRQQRIQRISLLSFMLARNHGVSTLRLTTRPNNGIELVLFICTMALRRPKVSASFQFALPAEPYLGQAFMLRPQP
jgi:hypothetical protein